MSGGALRGRIGLLVAVSLAALTLRPQLVGLGPVLPRAQDALGVSHSVAALLGAIPVIGMGIFAPAAAPLAARVGAIRAVTVAHRPDRDRRRRALGRCRVRSPRSR